MKNLFYKSLVVFLSIAIIAFLGSMHYFSNEIINSERITFANFGQSHPDEAENPSLIGLAYSDAQITIHKNSKTICHGWYIPATQRTDKLIVLIHGRDSNRRKVLKYAPFLHDAGYNIFLMDFRNSGFSYSAACSFGYYESQELLTALKHLETKYSFNHIGILGLSMGAATTVLAAEQNQAIKTIILDSPYISFREIIKERAQKEYPYIPKFYVDLVLTYTGFRLGFDVNEVDPGRILYQNKQLPVLIIHGALDEAVSQKNGRELYTLAASPKEAWFIKDVDHVDAFLKYPEQYKQKTLGFLEKYL